MFKKFNITDILLLISALSSLIFSEILFFFWRKRKRYIYWIMGSIYPSFWYLFTTH